MRPQTIERWAQELRLSWSEKTILSLIGERGEATKPEMVARLYGHREDGGPLAAENVVSQFLTSLKKKLAGRATINSERLYTLEIYPGRREP